MFGNLSVTTSVHPNSAQIVDKHVPQQHSVGMLMFYTHEHAVPLGSRSMQAGKKPWLQWPAQSFWCRLR